MVSFLTNINKLSKLNDIATPRKAKFALFYICEHSIASKITYNITAPIKEDNLWLYIYLYIYILN